jgi:hypothetical protein
VNTLQGPSGAMVAHLTSIVRMCNQEVAVSSTVLVIFFSSFLSSPFVVYFVFYNFAFHFNKSFFFFPLSSHRSRKCYALSRKDNDDSPSISLISNPSIKFHYYSSSFFPSPSSSFDTTHKAGVVPVNRYSHFSGSLTPRSSFSVPHVRCSYIQTDEIIRCTHAHTEKKNSR